MTNDTMKWRCTWGEGYVDEGEKIVGSTFFAGRGYSYEDIGRIVSLEVGEALDLSDLSGSHVVERVQ